MYYDDVARQALAQSKERFEEGGGEDNRWADMSPRYRDSSKRFPVPRVVRLLPSYRIVLLGQDITPETILPWLKLFYHGKVLPSMDRKVLCPKMSRVGHGTCAICDTSDRASASKASIDQQFGRSLKPRPKFFVPVYHPEELELGVQLWGMPPTAYEVVAKLHHDTRWGPLDDPKSGRDIEVEITENPGGYWEYKVTPVPERSPIILPDWKNLMFNPEDMLLNRIPTYDQLKRLLMGEQSKDVFRGDKANLSDGQKSDMAQAFALQEINRPVHTDDDEDEMPMSWPKGKKPAGKKKMVLDLGPDKPKPKKMRIDL